MWYMYIHNICMQVQVVNCTYLLTYLLVVAYALQIPIGRYMFCRDNNLPIYAISSKTSKVAKGKCV